MARVKTLERAAEVHKTGYYCYAACLRDILEYYGTKLSFDMTFGLLGGVSFYYARHDLQFPGFAPFMWFAGDPGIDPTENLCKALCVYHDTGIDADPDQGWETVMRFINRGQPVMIDIVFNSQYVQYLNVPAFIKKNLASMQPTSVFERTASGGQRCIVYGYDLDRDVALHIEPVIPAPNTIPIPVLKQLRSDTSCYFPPQNRWSVFYVPSGPLPLRRAIRESIRLTVSHMFNPPTFEPLSVTVGLPGLRAFCSEVGDWPALYPDPLVRDSLQALYVVAWGIGRGQFRGFYAGFLTEAAAILGEPRLVDIAGEYRRLAKLWETLAKLALVSSRDPATGLTGQGPEDKARRRTLLDEVLEGESAAMERLREVVAGERG